MVAEHGVDARVVGSRRSAWRIIARVEQKDAQQATHEREYAGKVPQVQFHDRVVDEPVGM